MSNSPILTSKEDHNQGSPTVSISVEGRKLEGQLGQSIAGILLANNYLSWRSTANANAPRGLFCGIGVCFDCLVTVDGVRDVRACQRMASEGAKVEFQRDGEADL